jgi:hypothetical protein
VTFLMATSFEAAKILGLPGLRLTRFPAAAHPA